MSQIQNNIHKNRIVKNTLLLYVRQFVIMVVHLYTVRAILNILGVDDFGVFSAVAGFVMMLSFLTGTMGSATQRFFSFALGKKDMLLLKKVFGTNVIIYLFLSLIAILLLETVGLWFVHFKLSVPLSRFNAVQILYQFTALRFIFMLISAPCIAILIAHEEMNCYATISIIEAGLNLLVVLFLPCCAFDKLISYGVLTALLSSCITLIYVLTCIKRYPECSLRKICFDRGVLKEIVNFTGWTLFGCMSTMARTQAVTVLLNQVFTPAVVAARAVALNVSGAVNTFSNNFNTGIYPPIIKAWSNNERQEMYKLIYLGCKISFFLTWIVAVPCFWRIDFILNLWLGKVPEMAGLFIRLVLIENMILAVSLPIATAARAPGNMREYELTLGIIQFLIFPFSLVALYLGAEAYSTLIIAIIANVIMFFVRLHIVHKLIDLPLKPFYTFVLKPILYCLTTSCLLSWGVHFLLGNSAVDSILAIIVCLIISGLSIFFLGLSKTERTAAITLVMSKIRRNNI